MEGPQRCAFHLLLQSAEQDSSQEQHGPVEEILTLEEAANLYTASSSERPLVAVTSTHWEVVTKTVEQAAQESTSAAASTTSTATESDAPQQTGVQLDEYLKDLLNWQRPLASDGHWPRYEDYADRDYDPNRWEAFKLEDGYYKSGTKRLPSDEADALKIDSPYPDYRSEQWKRRWKGDFVPCEGPRGIELTDSIEDSVRVYPGVPPNFPKPLVGSSAAIGLADNICVDRLQRYGPYGYNPLLRFPISIVDWDNVDWGELQNKCLGRNKERFAPHARVRPAMKPDFANQDPVDETLHEEIRREEPDPPEGEPQYEPRTAVLIRTWEGYDYSQNDVLAIRAMVSELALRTGGTYQVFLFVNIKDRGMPIHTSPAAYDHMLAKTVPRELRSIAVLWNEDMVQRMYPLVGDWQVYWHQYMPVQWFAETHPQFDYVWNWEVDVRSIGNHFHLLDRLGDFAAKQPRKYLWERNARFFIPSHHGDDFSAFAKASNAIIAESAAAGNITPVWGPQPFSPLTTPLGPTPPTAESADDFTWGVGEEADFITLLPMWDPIHTFWTMKNKVWNFSPGIAPSFTAEHPTDDGFYHPYLDTMPRRGFINTVTRLSRRLLRAMHAENRAGRTTQAEMWPSTAALHHGLKAVYAPHPVYSGHTWPGRYADLVFNADGGIGGRWGQERDSIYNQDREVNFRDWSWYYHAGFPRVLYRRWMGWRARDAAGEFGGTEWEEGERGPGGRMCLPPMLLHPVKRGDLELV
ncbi:hypothetical protein EJ06DRAFT_541772 [Trichodelitschia bisporula]|uniref:Uncharacterized protein n=1 Tax=Trichodelitschia bisporula TaxID=703511 RepID=A0A6G1I4A4_9PEZI|nr:hypothetical protein EJ06DRAFT_541772 [Trichodelitschia bisporula]